MKITEIRIFLKDGSVGDGKLKAFATITFDSMFVVRDLKIIEGKTGRFVAMPSVRMSMPCPKCHKKNSMHSKFCNECGMKLEGASISGNIKFGKDTQREGHRDIAHPITSKMRQYVQKEVLRAYDLAYKNFDQQFNMEIVVKVVSQDELDNKTTGSCILMQDQIA